MPHLILMTSILMLMVNGKALMVNQLSSIVQEMYQEIHLLVLFLIIQFLNFILVDKLFVKTSRRFTTRLLGIIYVNLSLRNNLCEKLASSLELSIIFDDSLSVASVSFFVAGFNLLSSELDNFTFALLNQVILY